MGQQDLLVSITMDQDFLGKVTHSRHVFFISITQWNVEEDNTIIRKLAKGKGKTYGKDGKTGKCAKKQENKLINSFENYNLR